MPEPSAHSILSLWLDVVDKLVKASAVLLGGIWTYWNYKKSRTYEKKMELTLQGKVFPLANTYVEVEARLKNLGAAQHAVEQKGTYCRLSAIHDDLSEETLDSVPVFTQDQVVEPGETISDRFQFIVKANFYQIVWLKLSLRVVSGEVEWQQTDLIRVQLSKLEAALNEENSDGS